MNKRRDIRNFYSNEEFIPVWEAFGVICDREGVSRSERIRGFIKSYVDRHGNGNPQLMLQTFGSEHKKRCGLCGELTDKLWRVRYASKLVIPSCKECIEEKREKGTVRKVLGMV